MRRRYEVWFVRCGMADGSGAWWFRYLLVNNIKISPEIPARRHFQVWATWFPRGAAPQSFIVEIPIDRLDLSMRGHVPFHYRASESGIEEGRCWGNLRPDGHHISWNLRTPSRFAAKLSDKGWIGFSRSPHSDAALCGEIILTGKNSAANRWDSAYRGTTADTATAATGAGCTPISRNPKAAARWKRWCTTCRSGWSFEMEFYGIAASQ